MTWNQALDHLRRKDRVMRRIIDRVGPCTLAPRKDYFPALCQSIVSQQVSGTVAKIIYGRFAGIFPARRPRPGTLLLKTETDLDGIGLSRQKRAYLLDLARHFEHGLIPYRRFPKMEDEQIIESLVNVKGIGRWTAEMFLIFVLNRPDLLPVDDLGIRKNAMEAYGLTEMPKADELISIGEKWRPWRTVATWYLWRHGDTARKTEKAAK